MLCNLCHDMAQPTPVKGAAMHMLLRSKVCVAWLQLLGPLLLLVGIGGCSPATTTDQPALTQGCTLQEQHGVDAVAFAPDGATLASAADDTIRLWDVATARERTVLRGHSQAVWAVAFSPDGQTLASGSRDGTVKLWDVAAGKARNTLRGHTDWVRSVAFTPDGRTLVSASTDGTVRLWNLADCQTRAVFGEDQTSFWTMALAPDGQTLGTVSVEGTLIIWNVDAGKKLVTYAEVGAVAVAFSPDSHCLAAASLEGKAKVDGMVRLWDVCPGTERLTFTAGLGNVKVMAFSPGGRFLATAGFDRVVKLWDARTGKAVGSFAGHTKVISALAFSPTGQTLASGSWDKTVRFWDVTSEK